MIKLKLGKYKSFIAMVGFILSIIFLSVLFALKFEVTSAYARDINIDLEEWILKLEWNEPPLSTPTVGFTNSDGQPLTLSDFKGSGVVLNLWATWCAPCVQEMPALNALQRQVKKEGIEVVAVSSDRLGVKVVGPFFRKKGLNDLRIYVDTEGVFTESMPGYGLPRTYFINREGLVIATYNGPAEWDSTDIISVIRELTQ